MAFLFLALYSQLGISFNQPSNKNKPNAHKSNRNNQSISKANDTRYFKRWNARTCVAVESLLQTNRKVINQLGEAIHKVEDNQGLGEKEKRVRANTFRIFVRELRESEQTFYSSLNSLRRSLRGGYQSIEGFKLASKRRLESLRKAALREEQEYNAILQAERYMDAVEKVEKYENQTDPTDSDDSGAMGKIMDDVVQGLIVAADRLEAELHEDIFEQTKKLKGARIQAVIKVDADALDNSKHQKGSQEDGAEDRGLSILIDSKSNQYVLSKPKDATIPHEDHHLIQDIVFIILMAFLCGWFCSLLTLPAMFGFILCGMILGPSGENALKNLVQIETLGEFGVLYILFVVGMEFSPDRVKRIWKTAVFGTAAELLGLVSGGLILGAIFGIKPNQTFFVAASLSISSTPLIVKFFQNTPPSGRCPEKDYESHLLGVLVMQDVMLGLLIAILPALAGKTATADGGAMGTVMVCLKLIGSLVGLVLLCFILSRYVVGHFFRLIQNLNSNEMLCIAALALAYSMLLITDALNVSMELGCFMAGVMISAQGHHMAEKITELIEPLRDFFACIFFTCMGLHLFPTFIMYEWTILLTVTFAVVFSKFLIGVTVMTCLLPRTYNIHWIVGAGLAQISEFAFVLGCRGQEMGLISREMYLIMLTITMLSFLIAPFIWRVAIWKFGQDVILKPTSTVPAV
ncbi:uncharacterized protein TRIADDRAFT_30483 [Trichoplax adhaerens]|uniref:Cation/H+ exchanger transmembrane domain-containing protein n=1 Tax=Trichoplax adhaerens TaxID=10228 RepID=B3S7L0_TRIAD|nr:hypothetical protein TRIADDRAFT_30483 [Trichoplax adhaerens]EDV21309.1 hypothetical protein TRIADDRAFT_30483 [Trichoplax adhaerens]|eukprot:XP_002116276.1 hypothetical protein TRIADDRAFT_30483 [Trichoplax adhaerens]